MKNVAPAFVNACRALPMPWRSGFVLFQSPGIGYVGFTTAEDDGHGVDAGIGIGAIEVLGRHAENLGFILPTERVEATFHPELHAG